LAWGGSRSGKTFTFCRADAVRAMKAPGSRHLIARFRFNHVVQSIWHDTLPKVMATCFPSVEVKQDKANWFWSFPNGSEIWFRGLDDKERTEKVLALCSAQKRRRLRPLANESERQRCNLSATYLAELQALPARERLRFWEGRFGTIGENALWTFEGIETYRKAVRPDLPRIIIAVDPSGTKRTEAGDFVGIVVVGLGLDGNAYLLEDCSVSAPPAVWGRVVVNAFDRHAADCIIAETNFGGAILEAVVRAAAADAKLHVRFKEVRASRGKVIRAEPVAALYEQGKVHHVGAIPALEDQLISFTTSGYMGDGSARSRLALGSHRTVPARHRCQRRHGRAAQGPRPSVDAL
jgi:hypothetical protein